jgi:hypothetical protein
MPEMLRRNSPGLPVDWSTKASIVDTLRADSARRCWLMA